MFAFLIVLTIINTILAGINLFKYYQIKDKSFLYPSIFGFITSIAAIILLSGIA